MATTCSLSALNIRLRYCREVLADVDDWEAFFPAVLALKQELEPLRPKPYVGSPPIGIPPAGIEELWNKIEALEACKITVCEFLDFFDQCLNTMDAYLYKVVSLSRFYAAQRNLLAVLAVANSNAMVEKPDCKAIAAANVNKALAELWTTFSALPDDEKKKRLTPPPTKAEE